MVVGVVQKSQNLHGLKGWQSMVRASADSSITVPLARSRILLALLALAAGASAIAGVQSNLAVQTDSPDLRELSCGGTAVTDLRPLADMPLEKLSFSPQCITAGLDAVRAKRTLRRIRNEGDTRTWGNADFVPAELFWKAFDAGKMLDDAGVEYTRIRVDEEEMYHLDLSKTGVKSLVPLAPLVPHLVWLDLTKTDVNDLGPISKAPLLYLGLYATGVTNLAPLADMPLEDLRMNPNHITAGLDALRKKRSMVRLGTFPGESMPPYVFWQKVDNGYFRRTLD